MSMLHKYEILSPMIDSRSGGSGCCMLECTLPNPPSSRTFQFTLAFYLMVSSPFFDFLSNPPTCLVAVWPSPLFLLPRPRPSMMLYDLGIRLWRQAHCPASQQSATGGGVLLAFLKDHRAVQANSAIKFINKGLSIVLKLNVQCDALNVIFLDINSNY